MNDIKAGSSNGQLRPSVVITGATEGIGRALAYEFARDGHTLVLVARNAVKLAETAAELKRIYPIEVKVTAQDLATLEGCDGVEQAVQRFGLYADILVNNAGIMSSGFFQDEDPENARRLVDLDVRALVDLTRRFLPGMVERGRGGVLNMSSMMGYMPVPYEAAYAASKAFVLSFSKALAYETMGTGIRISVAAPGVVATALHKKAGGQNSRYLFWFPAWTPEQIARTAYRRFNRGWTTILPGIIAPLSVLVMRFVPDFLLVPLMGWFFRVRDEQGRVLWPGGTLSPTPKRRPATEPARAEPLD